jgi:PAS domain S-box-containing protein
MIAIYQSSVLKYVNRAMCERLGWTFEELTSASFDAVERLTAEDYQNLVRENVARRLLGESIAPYEIKMKSKDGQEIPIIVYAQRILYHGEPADQISYVDITERKKAEEALRESEKQYKTLFQSTLDGMFVLDAETLKVVLANQALAKMYGFPSPEDVIGVNPLDFIPPEDGERVTRIIVEDMFKKDLRQVNEFRTIARDGREIWVNTLGTRIEYQGRLAGLISIRDITERKQAEEALRDSEEELNAIFHSVQDGIALIDITTSKAVRVNRRVVEVGGYAPEEIVGKSLDVLNVFPPKSVEAILSTADSILSGQEVPPFEVEAYVRSGERLDLELRISPLQKAGKVVAAVVVMRNITEHKQAEELFRTLANSSPVGIYIVQGGRFQFVNPQFQKYVGYSEDELLGMDSLSLIASQDRNRVRRNAVKMLKGERSSPYEYRFVNRDGETRWAMETVASIQYRGRRAALGNFMDITERKQAEEALWESERRYRLLAENVTDVIWTTDMNLRPTYLSPSITRLLGYSLEEAMSHSMEESLTPASLEIAAKAFVEALTVKGMEEKEQLRLQPLEVELYRKDGSTVWAEVTISSLRDKDGQRIGFLGVDRDITERKQAEEALRESEEKFRHLAEEISDGIAVILGGKIYWVNQAFCDTFGYTREELLGKGVDYLTVPEELPSLTKLTKARRTRRNFPSRYETIGKCKDGRTISVEVSAKQITFEGKQAIQIATRDITERKQAEAERREMEQKAQIQSRLASVGEMASGIAHEVNNPLASVVGFSELLMDRDLPKDIREDIKTIHQGAQRVASIVKRLLTFARQQKPERDYININDIITTTLNLRAYEMETSNIKVITQLDPDLPRTIADGGQLQQVFLNIILNAETEMKSAHGKGNLFIKTETIDNTLRISFKDDGPGIVKENLERIFDPFFTTREVGKGTGLGLSICHGIVTEHGGRIYAQSKPGKGATFIVELPIVTKPEQLKLAEPTAGESEEVDRANILVVDDEPAILRFLSRVLTKEGYQVETVDNGDDALESLESKRYSLILLDIKLPGVSGIEIYKRIQKMSQSLARRVVFVTGDVMGTDTKDFLSRTKAPYIVKPFDTAQLKKKIGQMFTQMA